MSIRNVYFCIIFYESTNTKQLKEADVSVYAGVHAWLCVYRCVCVCTIISTIKYSFEWNVEEPHTLLVNKYKIHWFKNIQAPTWYLPPHEKKIQIVVAKMHASALSGKSLIYGWHLISTIIHLTHWSRRVFRHFVGQTTEMTFVHRCCDLDILLCEVSEVQWSADGCV